MDLKANSNAKVEKFLSWFLLIITAFFIFKFAGLDVLALTSVTLNSGSTQIGITTDISSQATGLTPDTGAYRWRVSNSDLTKINLPFNTGATQTNIASAGGGGSDGTLGSGAVFTTTGCKVGGCVDFDGSNNGVVTFTNFSSGSQTISAWIYPRDNTDRTLFDANGTYTAWRVYLTAGGKLAYSHQSNNPGVNCVTATGATTISQDQWTHVAATFNGTNLTVFVNGVSDGTASGTNFAGPANTDLKIGKGHQGINSDSCINTVPPAFTGLIDEFQFYSRVASATQLSQLVTDGNAGVGGPTKIKTSELVGAEIWSLSISPVTSAGSVGSAVTATNTVTINASPVAGFTADNTIPAAQITQSTTGSGIVNVNFKVRDSETNTVTLKSFGYSTNGGTSFTDVADGSASFSNGWPNNNGPRYNSAASLEAATSYTFSVNTKHTDQLDMNFIDSGAIQFRFKVNDGYSDSGYVTTANFALDNAAPSLPITWTISNVTAVPAGYGAPQTSLDAVDANNVFICYVVGNNLYLAKSTNGGTSFTTGTLVTDESNGDCVIKALDVNTIFIVFQDQEGDDRKVKILKSTDGGATWPTLRTVHNGPNSGHDMSIAIADANNIFVSFVLGSNTSPWVGRSTDGGLTWNSAAADAFPSGNYNSIKALDANNLYISYKVNSPSDLRMAKSVNGGVTWTPQTINNSNPYGTDIALIDANNIFVSYYSGVGGSSGMGFAKTNNGGSTWTSKIIHSQFGISYNSTIIPFDPSNIFISYYHSANLDLVFAQTTDGGTNWKYSELDTTGDVGQFSSMDAVASANTLFISYRDATGNNLKLAKGVFSPSNITTRPTAGDTTVSLSGTMGADTNIGSNQFQLEINSVGYSAGSAGQASTLTPTNQATSVGAALKGTDLITKIRLAHTDAKGNLAYNENRALTSSLAAVMPLVPSAPTATRVSNSSANVKVNANPSDTGDVQFSIRVVADATSYVQTDGTLGAGAVYRTYSGWGGAGGVTVSGLTTGTTYSISTNARNPSGDNPTSAYGSAASYTHASEGGVPASATASTPPTAPTASMPIATSTDKIRWNFKDNAKDEIAFNLQNADGQTLTDGGLQTNLTYLDETGLLPNTQYRSRKVCAYNRAGTSCSAILSPIYTLISPLTSTEIKNTSGRTITIEAKGAFPNLENDKTGLLFENLSATGADSSGWIKSTSHTFTNLQPETEYVFRVKVRNGDGIETTPIISSAKTGPLKEPNLIVKVNLEVNSGTVLGSIIFSQDTTWPLDFVNQNLNLILAIFFLAVTTAAIKIFKNLKRTKFKTKDFIAIFIWAPSRSFQLMSSRDLKGTYTASYARHKHLQKYGAAGFLGLLLTSLLKISISGMIFLNSQASQAVEPSLPEIKLGDQLTFRVDYQNIGTDKASNVVIAAKIPEFTQYLNGSMLFNGRAQTDANDEDNAFKDAEVLFFKIRELVVNQKGTIQYQTIVNQDSETVRESYNAVKVTYQEKPQGLDTIFTTFKIAARPKPPILPPQPSPEPSSPNNTLDLSPKEPVRKIDKVTLAPVLNLIPPSPSSIPQLEERLPVAQPPVQPPIPEPLPTPPIVPPPAVVEIVPLLPPIPADQEIKIEAPNPIQQEPTDTTQPISLPTAQIITQTTTAIISNANAIITKVLTKAAEIFTPQNQTLPTISAPPITIADQITYIISTISRWLFGY